MSFKRLSISSTWSAFQFPQLIQAAANFQIKVLRLFALLESSLGCLSNRCILIHATWKRFKARHHLSFAYLSLHGVSPRVLRCSRALVHVSAPRTGPVRRGGHRKSPSGIGKLQLSGSRRWPSDTSPLRFEPFTGSSSSARHAPLLSQWWLVRKHALRWCASCERDTAHLSPTHPLNEPATIWRTLKINIKAHNPPKICFLNKQINIDR